MDDYIEYDGNIEHDMWVDFSYHENTGELGEWFDDYEYCDDEEYYEDEDDCDDYDDYEDYDEYL